MTPLKLGLVMLVMGPLSASQIWAQFVDTTSGSPDEKANGINADDYDAKSKKIIESFKEGRLSSAKKNNSRFAAHIEYHDSNMDGAADHEASNYERTMNALLGGGSILDKVKESSKKLNMQNCGKEEGTLAKNEDGSEPGYMACFNPSGIIVDTGAAHGGENSSHRKLKLSKEAQDIADEQGKAMGGKTIEDIKASIVAEMSPEQRAAFDADPNRKVAGLDLLRSENIWAEDLKESIYDRDAKKLRAARLAGEDEVSRTQEGTIGAALMGRVDEIYGRGGGEEEVAQTIAAINVAKDEKLIKQGDEWVPTSTMQNPPSTPTSLDISPEQWKILAKSKGVDVDNASDLQDFKNSTTDIKLEDLAKIGVDENVRRQALSAAEQAVLSDDAKKMIVEKAKADIINNGCLTDEVWCHNKDSARRANPPATGGTSASTNPIEAFTPHAGDPGAVFHDTREIISLQAKKAMNVPITEMRKTLKNADFNEQTHPEVFDQITQLEESTKELEDETKEMGGKNIFDQSKQTLRETVGIKQGVNDSWSSEVDVESRGERSGLRDISSESNEPDDSGSNGNVAPANRPSNNTGGRTTFNNDMN